MSARTIGRGEQRVNRLAFRSFNVLYFVLVLLCINSTDDWQTQVIADMKEANLATIGQVDELIKETLHASGNVDKEKFYAAIGEIFERSLKTKGPIADTLNEAARKVVEGGKSPESVVQDLIDAIEQGGMGVGKSSG